MNFKCIFIPVILLLSFGVNAATPMTKIEVFVEHPLVVAGIPNTDITVFDLSRKDAVKASAPKFSPNATDAQELAKAWLNSPEGKSYIVNLRAAYTGHTKMISYGVLKIPAIVFDGGKFVIYGTTDIQQAVMDYDNYVHAKEGVRHE